jgi:hypothetical protein
VSHTAGIIWYAAGLVVAGGLTTMLLWALLRAGLPALIGAHSSHYATGTVTKIVQPGRATTIRPQVEFTTSDGTTISFTEPCLYPASVGDTVAVHYHPRWPQKTATLSPSREIWRGIRLMLPFVAASAMLALYALGELIARL